MSAKYAPEDTRLWIEEAQARLNHPKSPGKSQDDKTPPTGGRDGNSTR